MCPHSTAPQPVQRFTVPEWMHERRIERILRHLYPGSHPGRCARLLRQQRVVVAGRVLQPREVVAAGTEIEILPRPPGPVRHTPNRKIRIPLLYQDDSLAVINKPAGRPVHPGPGHGTDTLLNGLLADPAVGPPIEAMGPDNNYGLVHRLDRGTSGVLVMALTPESREHLIDQFKHQLIKKEYDVLVWGECRDGSSTVSMEGRPAKTIWKVVEQFSHHALLRVIPKTGRTHQIRIHLAGAGHQVAGDARYGRAPDGFPYPCLHAARLQLQHPATGEPMQWDAVMPRRFRRFLKRVERWDKKWTAE